jgi:hypothetical protein
MTDAVPAPKYALDETGKVIDTLTGIPIETIAVLSQPKPEEGVQSTKAPSSESPLTMLARWRDFRQSPAITRDPE